jgi:hypothetical protein
MRRRQDLPGGWRQPPETTAEPVPLRRPYVPSGDVFPPADLPPPRFIPRRRSAAPGQAPPPAAPPPPRRQPAMRRWRPTRAIIGDGYRVPMLWCEVGSCIGRYSSGRARGEHDLRARALAAGWCYDALGRLACLRCARHDPSFRSARDLVIRIRGQSVAAE